jgi:hypothetical protein
MVEYHVEGSVATIVGSGQYVPGEWDAVYDAVQRDAAVPEGASFIIDTRELNIVMPSVRMIDRVRNMRDRLGRKLGSACALVMSRENALTSDQFQHYAQQEINLRVGIFSEPSAAKRWLSAA